MENSRNIKIDILRCIAVFSVISVHFFLNSGFYDTPIKGTVMFFSTVIRTSFMVCVPLFLLITGYLMSGKNIEISKPGLKKFYGKISTVLIPYAVITVLIIIWRVVYKEQDLSLKDGILVFLGFDHYSWYVEMYIGLYLLIPFFNVIIKNLNSEKEVMYFAVVLLILSTLPTVFNIWNFKNEGWFSAPQTSNVYNDIIPEWWVNIYPVTYYFIGAYIRKNEKLLKKDSLNYFFMFVLCVLFFGYFNYWRSNGVNFIKGIWTSWNGFQNVIISVLMFLFVNSLKIKKVPKVISKIIFWISKLSFGTYLSSYIVDGTIYPILCEKIPDFKHRILWAPVMVLVSFVGSNVISALVYMAEKGVRSAIGKLSKKRSDN